MPLRERELINAQPKQIVRALKVSSEQSSSALGTSKDKSAMPSISSWLKRKGSVQKRESTHRDFIPVNSNIRTHRDHRPGKVKSQS